MPLASIAIDAIYGDIDHAISRLQKVATAQLIVDEDAIAARTDIAFPTTLTRFFEMQDILVLEIASSKASSGPVGK